MKLPAKFLTLASSLICLPLPALASGGVWCRADDANLAFDFSAGQSRDGSGGWFGLRGNVVSKADKLPADLAKFTIRNENLIERWVDRDSVRLKIEKLGNESQNFASVHLTVVAVALEELTYKGPYQIRIVLPDGSDITRDGSVACSAE